MLLQPGDLAIDYSYARPDPALIVSLGVRLVMRYISPRRANLKNATVSELAALRAVGLSVGLVWEDTKYDALGGGAAGERNGSLAASFAADLGYPPGYALAVACDTYTAPDAMPTVLDYLRAFGGACHYPIRPYGQDTVVTAAAEAGIASGGWQTRAWSNGGLSPYADVVQEIGYALYPRLVVLGAVDADTVLRPFTAWSDATLQPPGGETMNPKPVRDDRPDGEWQGWAYGIDHAGWEWADTVNVLGLHWEVFSAGVDVPVVPFASLDAIRQRQSRPTPIASSTPTHGTWEATG